MAGGSFGGGTGVENNPYIVEDLLDLLEVDNNLSSHFLQVNDIEIGVFTPLCPSDTGLTGSYDGGSHKLYNGTIVAEVAAPFNYLNGGTIKNITIENVDVEGTGQTGGVVRFAKDAIVENCHYIGGLLTIDPSFTASIGGVVSDAQNSQIVRCSAICDIDDVGISRAGGITSRIVGGTIEKCFFVGLIRCVGYGFNYLVGGIVGQINNNTSIVENCYTRGDIEFNTDGGSAGRVGGIIGVTFDTPTIKNCYSTCTVSGEYATTGGIIGQSAVAVENCYFNNGPDNGHGTLKTSSQLKNIDTFLPEWDISESVSQDEYGWNSSHIWGLGLGDDPAFANIWTKKGGTWKEIPDIWAKKDGVWKPIIGISTKKGGVWEPI